MKISTVSLNQIWENKDANMGLCEEAVSCLSGSNQDIIIFPEMTLTGFTMNPEKYAEVIEDSRTVDFFERLASAHNVGIIFGVCLNEFGGYVNCALYVDKLGRINSLYRKIHPFSFAGENNYYSSGSLLASFTIDEFSIGLTICYDLRFPELFRLYSHTCQLMVNIANWPEKRVDHWQTLLKARAIDNQYIVIGVNRTGRDGNGLDYVESSNIFLPNGEKLNYESSGSIIKQFVIDPRVVDEYRDGFPVFKDRKTKLYKTLDVYGK